MSEAVKRCARCSTSKPLTEFHRNKAQSDGVQSQCKPCHLDSKRRWQKANVGAARAYVAKQTARDIHRAQRYARAFKYFEGRPEWVALLAERLITEKRLNQMEWAVPALSAYVTEQEI